MAKRTKRAPRPAAAKAEAVEEAPKTGDLLNRELTWLEFNRRVLYQAVDPRTPLLERVRFLEIFSSNLDEFVMKRVGGLKRQIAAGIATRSADGLSAPQQLSAIRAKILEMIAQQAQVYRENILPALAQQGIHLLPWEDLTAPQKQAAEDYFHRNVFPVLTPLAVDPGHPFPFLSNLSMSLGVTLRHADKPQEKLFARIKIPEVLPRWVPLPNGQAAPHPFRFVGLIDLIRHNLAGLFREMTVLDVMPFRITRSADVEREEEDAEDLLEMIEQELRERRFAAAVRLEHGPDPDPWMLQFLKDELELLDGDVYEMPAELDFTGLSPVSALNLPELKFDPHVPATPPALADEEADIFAQIRKGDLLVHHPYESFRGSVERFVRAAVDDPRVLAIKMTVYRTGRESPFMEMLARAAEAGKQVVCLVELKARFDEQRNIQLAEALEKAGVHVVYGVVGLKTHTKTVLVVRQEETGVRCYAHIGTGNYNIATSGVYTDLSLLTCRPELTGDLVEVYNYLTGRSEMARYDKLLVAPVNMKERFMEMIAREIEHHKAGRPAHIVAKMNSLEMKSICRALYEASQAGVKIDLIVRGFCCLRPGVPGLSENIRVMSVIGRFLEHSRIFYFRNGAADPIDGEFYIGSADWMYRNMLARVEVIAPIEERALRRRLWEILQVVFADRRQAWDMHSDGTYILRQPTPDTEGAAAMGTQQTLIELTRRRGRKSE